MLLNLKIKFSQDGMYVFINDIAKDNCEIFILSVVNIVI